MNIIHGRQPKLAHGATKAKPFAKRPPIKRNRHAINTDQSLQVSPWVSSFKSSVDTERVNWKGHLFTSEYDPRPRLR